MANEVNRAVGIDLGTTYSLAAHLDHTGRPVSLRSAEGDLTTPSVVLFDDEDVVVGKEALKAAGRDWGSIDRILLVGGSTRMPIVNEMLRRISGKEPDASVSADEAVAQGAALQAGNCR